MERVALQARLGVGDLQLDGRGHVDVERVAIVQSDGGDLVLQKVVLGLADHVLAEVELVVGVGVHEHVRLAVVVQVLHLATVDLRGLHLRVRIEGAVDDLAAEHVLELAAHDSVALAGLVVLEPDHGPQLAVDVEDHAVLEVVGGNRCHSAACFRPSG